MTAMAIGTLVGALRLVRGIGHIAVLLALAGWSGTALADAAMDLEGTFKVTPNGTATYMLPIELPPGTNGMAPSLSLSYASTSGNGLLGMGWSLDGLPSISRCAQTMEQDNEIIGITFTGTDANGNPTDRYCFGGERLVPIASYTNSGTEYRTEIDGFSRIVSYPSSGTTGPAYWVIYTKDGKAMEFGNTADSFVQAAGLPATVARSWALDKVTDTTGNYYTVTYVQNASTGETYPLEVDYTGYSGQAPYNSVQFCYNTAGGDNFQRLDPIVAYLAGSVIQTTHRLSDVVTELGTQNNGAACGGTASNIVYDYHLSYQTNPTTGRSQLFKITQSSGTGGSGGALPSLLFTWQPSGIMNAANPLSGAFPAFSDTSQGGWIPYVADFNGDGLDDIFWTEVFPAPIGGEPTGATTLWLNNGNGTFTVAPSDAGALASQFYVGDFDGSGKSSVLVFNPQDNCFAFYTYMNGGLSGVPGQAQGGQGINATCNGALLLQNTPPSPSLSGLAVGDFEGTGRSSIAVVWENVSGGPGSCGPGTDNCNEFNLMTYTNSGNFYFQVLGSGTCLAGRGTPTSPCVINPGQSNPEISYQLFAADFNGDGKADLLIDATATAPQAYPSPNVAANEVGYRLVLLNEIGNPSFAATGNFAVGSQSVLNVPGTTVFVGDFNGDGIADILLNGVDGAGDSTGSRTLLLGQGDGTFVAGPALPAAYLGSNWANYEVTVGQFAGTGRSDILLTYSDVNWVSKVPRSGMPGAVLLLANADGSFSVPSQTALPNLDAPTVSRPFIGDFSGIGHDGIFWDQVKASTDEAGTTDLGSNGNHTLQLSDTRVSDVIAQVQTGLGAVTTINYQTLVQYAAATPPTTAPFATYIKDPTASVWPVLDVQNSMPVVTSTVLPDGVDGTGHPYAYGYVGAKSDLYGRGSLGFATFYEYDQGLMASENSYFLRTTQFNQTFPLTGSPSTTQTAAYLNGSGTGISLGQTTFNSYYTSPTRVAGETASENALTPTGGVGGIQSIGVPVFVAPGSVIDQHGDLDGSPLPSTLSNHSYDCATALPCFGALTGSNFYTPAAAGTQPSSTSTQNEYVTQTINSWCNDVDGVWLINLMLQSQVTRITPSDQTGQTKTNKATFDAVCGTPAQNNPPTGHALSKVVNFGATDTSQTLETDFGYDQVGNRNAVILRGSGEALRPTNTNWTNNNGLNNPAGPNLFQFPQLKTDPMLLQNQFGYDLRFGTAVHSIDQNGLSSYVNVDGFDRPTALARPDGTGALLQYSYCSSSLPAGVPACPALAAYAVTSTPKAVSVTTGTITAGAQIGPQSTVYFDELHRQIQAATQAFDGVSITQATTVYDAVGRITKVSQPYFSNAGTIYWTTTVPDELGRPVTVTTPDNTTGQPNVTHRYHGLTQVDTFATEPGISPPQPGYGGTEGFTTTRTALLQKYQVTDPIGNTTTYTYDDFGNPATVTDAAQNQTQFFYDLMNRLQKVVDPDSGTHQFTYLSTGEPTSDLGPPQSSGGPAVLALFVDYDLDGRLLQRNEADLTSIWVYDASANGKGKLAQSCTSPPPAPAVVPGTPPSCNNPSFSRTLSYDSLSRVSATTLSFGGSQIYSFEDSYVPAGQAGQGKLQSVINTGSAAVTTYSYTALGYFQQLSKTASGGSSTAVYAIASEDAAFRPLRTTLGSAALSNSVSLGTTSSLMDNYYYDQLFELVEDDNTAGVSKKFTYNTATGNLTSKSDVGTYSYGGQPQASGPHQLASIAPTINSAAVTNGVTTSYSYDPRGNTLAGDGTSYSWTSFDRAASVTQGVTTVSYTYDTEHRRVGATTTTNGTTVVGVNEYLWDDATGGYAELNIPTGAGGTWNDYFTARGSMVGMLHTPPATSAPPVMSYFHTDRQGSIVAISLDSGTVPAGEIYGFDAWGKRRKTDGTDDTGDALQRSADTITPRGYIQQEEIAGLVNVQNLNARVYDALIGRFVSADPIGLKGGPNLYAYAANNPTTKSDPTGLAPVSWSGSYGRFSQHVAADNAWESDNFGMAVVAAATAYEDSPDWSGVQSANFNGRIDSANFDVGVSVQQGIEGMIARHGAAAVLNSMELAAVRINSEIGGSVPNKGADSTTAPPPSDSNGGGLGGQVGRRDIGLPNGNGEYLAGQQKLPPGTQVKILHSDPDGNPYDQKNEESGDMALVGPDGRGINTKIGGWFIQFVVYTVDGEVKRDYLEAFALSKDRWRTPPANNDGYSFNRGTDTLRAPYADWGSDYQFRTSVAFYEGLDLPDVFVRRGDTFAGSIPATTQHPQLPPPDTSSLTRTWPPR